jgi:radical SAM superfamily enzyme YgiQ (UPF0313 family)
MPSRVLLISANRCTTPEPVFPLALAHLHAALRNAGHECRCLDVLSTTEPLSEIVRQFQPDLVGISIRNIDDVIIRQGETFFGESVELCRTLKQLGQYPVVLGGSGFSIFPRELLELSGADFGIAGEGESALLELVHSLQENVDYSRIDGLVFRRDGRTFFNAPRSRPFAREITLADRPESLTSHYLRASGVLNLQTQRGCGLRCCYCTYPVVEGRSHRRYPPEAVAAELETLSGAGARYAFIVDSVFNSSPRHVREICEAVLRRGVKMSWGCFLRPKGLTPELMQLMARAGLSHIEFGCDSFCDEVLESYQKDFTFADIRHSAHLAREANVDACFFLIAGGPGETMATLRQSNANSLELGASAIMAVVGMRIYPDTALHELALREGRLRVDTDLLQPHFYLAAGLEADAVFEQLQEFARHSPNWIVGTPNPAYLKLISRLRQRGVVGPLWSYFSAIQRLWPAGATGGPIP